MLLRILPSYDAAAWDSSLFAFLPGVVSTFQLARLNDVNPFL